MSRMARGFGGIAASWGLILSLAAFAAGAHVAAPGTAAVETQAGGALSGVRIPFVENRGQHDRRVAYSAGTFAGTVFVTRRGELVYSFPAADAGTGWVLRETLIGARTLQAKGADPSATRVSRFVGSKPADWQPDLATYNRVELGEAWEGVDVALQAHGNNVEKLFTVRPGADAARIRVRVAGGETLRVNERGELVVGTGNGDIVYTRPVAYQQKDQQRIPVEVAYALDGDRYGFALGAYDASLPVVIDPLLQATYLGTTDDDRFNRILRSQTPGAVFVAGQSCGGGFPGVASGAQALEFQCDGVIARLNPELTQLVRATYLGGSLADEILALGHNEAAGEIYVAGQTCSTNFPSTSGGVQAANLAGDCDAFVARLKNDLTQLFQSTYLGGSSATESAMALYVDAAQVYVAGATQSTDFPGTAGGAQAAKASGTGGDGFIARLNTNLTVLSQASYLGGTADDAIRALEVAANGQAYVAGRTCSTNLPATTGGAQSAAEDACDGFIARFNAGLTQIVQATYMGTDNEDELFDLSLDASSGNAYAAGTTHATNGTFGNGLIVAVNANLTQTLGAAVVGGSGEDDIYAIGLSPETGQVFVAGTTCSLDLGGVAGGVDTTLGVPCDAFAARLNTALSQLLQATYLGSLGTDEGLDLAVDIAEDQIYVTGSTDSLTFPGTTGGPQTGNAGGEDGFVARISSDLSPPDSTPDAFQFVDQTGVARSTQITSNTIILTGFNQEANISVSGGEYSVNGGNFKTAAGKVTVNDTVRVRHTSASGFGVSTHTILTIGGVSDTFTTTTEAADTAPNAFSFPAKTGVDTEVEVISDPVTITGINTAAPISVSAGSAYSINGAAFTTAPGTITDGQQVRVGHISSATPSTSKTTTLNIGGVTGTFTSTTAGPDTTPDAFAFVAVNGVAPNTEQISNQVTITGINTATPISVTGGQYKIDNGSFTSASGTISKGQKVTLTHVSAATPGTSRTTTLTVGSVSGSFVSTTTGPVVQFGAPTSGTAEGGTASIPVTLSGPSGQPVSVPFTLSGTATGGGTDFSVPTASPLVIAAGQTSGVITVNVVNDAVAETDETVIVTLGTPTGATLGASTIHTMTVPGNDLPAVQFAQANSSVAEDVAGGSVTVAVQLSGASTQEVTVPFTLGGTAATPADYTASASPLVFAAGETQKTITLTLVDDADAEGAESIILTLGTPTNASKGAQDQHVATIGQSDFGDGGDGGALGAAGLAGLFALWGLRRRRGAAR